MKSWLLGICLICLYANQVCATDQIIDGSGNTVVIHHPFQRIISLYGAHTENLFRLGLDSEIIGVSAHETFPSQALKRPRYSQRDDPEKFLAARPDLVLIRPMIHRAYPRLVDRLEQSGITVVSLQPGSIEQMYTYWITLGKLTGTESRARKMVTAFQNAVASFKAISQPIHPKKRVYFEAIHSKMKTFTPDAMPMFVLNVAGGINIATDATQVRTTNIAAYGKERILSHARQIDVYLAQTGTMNAVTVEMIKSEPGFQIIKAVQENQVFLVEEQKVSRPTFRLLKGILEIGLRLYPDQFEKAGKDIINTAEQF